jgi:hypothetical protein
VLYSSGLVAGKRRQKKDSEPARKASDVNPVTQTPGCVSCRFITLKGQPDTRSSRLRRIRGKVRPLWVLCPQPFPTFRQEAISRTWTDHFITPFIFISKKIEYTPFVRGEEKTGKPIILQKMWAIIGDKRLPAVQFLL